MIMLKKILKEPLVIHFMLIVFGLTLVSFASAVQGDYSHPWLTDLYWPVFVGAFIVVTVLTSYHATYETERIIRTWLGHAVRAIIRAAVLFSFSWWILPAEIAGVAQVIGSINMLHIAFFVYLWGIFAIEFDIFYAVIKGHHWLYLGKVAIQDKVFGKRAVLLLALDVAVCVTGLIWSTSIING